MTGFDDIDRRFRKKSEIKLEPREEGDCCPDPNCGGQLAVVTRKSGHPTAYMVLACDRCDEQFGETCP